MEAVVDIAATALVVGKGIAKHLGVLKRAQKAVVWQANRSKVKRGKVIVNTSFVILHIQLPSSTSFPNFTSILSSNLSPSKFSLDAEVFDLRHKDIILGLSWLCENGFSVDIPNSCLFNSVTGITISCTTHNIPSITLCSIDNEKFELEEGEILLILHTRKQYSRYATVFSAEQAACLPLHTKWDYKILCKDPNVRVLRGRAIYKTMWKERGALQRYLEEHVPTGKVR